MYRKAENYEPCPNLTVADGCCIHALRRFSAESSCVVVAFSIFSPDSKHLRPTNDSLKTSIGETLLEVCPEDTGSWREVNIDLVNDVELAKLVEALAEKSTDREKYNLWRKKGKENREVVIVVTHEWEQPRRTAPIIEPIMPYQNCSLSPTGVHILDRRLLLPAMGTKPLETGLCKFCHGLFGIEAFPK